MTTKTKTKEKKHTVSFSVKQDDLKKADSVFKSLGIDREKAFSWFTREVARKGKMPFETQDPFYSKENMDSLRKSAQDAREGKLTPHEPIEV